MLNHVLYLDFSFYGRFYISNYKCLSSTLIHSSWDIPRLSYVFFSHYALVELYLHSLVLFHYLQPYDQTHSPIHFYVFVKFFVVFFYVSCYLFYHDVVSQPRRKYYHHKRAVEPIRSTVSPVFQGARQIVIPGDVGGKTRKGFDEGPR